MRLNEIGVYFLCGLKKFTGVNIPLKIHTSSVSWRVIESEPRRVKKIKDSSGWNRLLINPERHLGKNDCHNARSVDLYHEVAHLPLQMEINCHY